MYKSKLQELCQKNSWRVPEYTATKHGLDHCPSFSAAVVVNDMSFETQSLSKSSREAQNDAAKLAFDELSSLSSRPLLPPSSSFPQPSLHSFPPLSPTNSLQLQANTNPNHRDVPQVRLYKSELQNYAQKRNITFPVYTSDREGPPHASRFKCKVAVDGHTFDCPEFFPNLREAEHAAAKLALASLSSDGAVHCDDSAIYKNLLQQLLQKEGIPLPAYSTQRSGQVHAPVFVSSVDVNGESFTGWEAKTKKQAEISAAKVAYDALKDRNCKLIQAPLHSTPPQQVQEATQLLPSCAQPSISTELHMPVIPTPTPTPLHDAEDTAGNGSLGSAIISNDSTIPNAGPGKSMNDSSPHSASNCSTDSVAESSPHQSSAKINLAYKNIIVYPANKQIPKGSTLLPICDHNWNAFCAPEEKC